LLLARFRGGFGGEKFFSLGYEAVLLGGWQGESGARFGREFVEGKGVGCVEFALPLGEAEDVPALDGDPVDACHVGGGDDAFDFEKLGVALGAGGVGDHRATFISLIAVEVDEGEHFAADGLVSDPEDEVGAPLHGLDCVGKGEDIGADAFGVDGCTFPRGTPLPPTTARKPLFASTYEGESPSKFVQIKGLSPNSCKQMGYIQILVAKGLSAK
jgi:hypothetical protein